MKIIGVLILLFFYSLYLGKMILQKRKGIQTDHIAKGKKRDRTFYIELILKCVTYGIVGIQVFSILLVKTYLATPFIVIGMIFGIVGDLIFTVAVFTMKDSWRAGLAEEDKTELITNGIYQYSRNPAFLGFDCVYVGILLMFFNPVLLLFTIIAVKVLHIQILQEEKYLPTVFGAEYENYKSQVCRYIGRKRIY